jgi:hypothetical protein
MKRERWNARRAGGHGRGDRRRGRRPLVPGPPPAHRVHAGRIGSTRPYLLPSARPGSSRQRSAVRPAMVDTIRRRSETLRDVGCCSRTRRMPARGAADVEAWATSRCGRATAPPVDDGRVATASIRSTAAAVAGVVAARSSAIVGRQSTWLAPVSRRGGHHYALARRRQGIVEAASDLARRPSRARGPAPGGRDGAAAS